MEKQVLGFRAAIEHKLLLLSKCFQVLKFVLLANDVFTSCCLGISIFGSKPGLLWHKKDKKWTTPSENQAFCAALELSFWSPESANFGQWKKQIITNWFCSGIIKYFCAAQKSSLLFGAAHRNKQKYFDAFSLLWDDIKKVKLSRESRLC